MAVIGRIARAHGIRGQVVVNLETDFPHERFRSGAEFFVNRSNDPDRMDTLIIGTVRFHNERPVVGFQGVDHIDAAIAHGLTLAWNERFTIAECVVCGNLMQPGKGRVARTCSPECRVELHRRNKQEAA